jgi:hypothetical protein
MHLYIKYTNKAYIHFSKNPQIYQEFIDKYIIKHLILNFDLFTQ